MKKMLLSLILLAGCVGSDVPNNPMETEKPEVEVWWRATTAGVKKADNPWEKFVHPNPAPNWFDPWATDDLSQYSVGPIFKGIPASKSVTVEEKHETLPKPKLY